MYEVLFTLALTGHETQRGSLSLLQDLGETISQCLSVCLP